MTTIDATVDPPDLKAAASIAATAAASVPGVHALGSLVGRASDAVRERVGLASAAPGVKIDTDRRDTVTATISIVVDYPHKLREVSGAVRTAVRDALQPLGRGTIGVNVVVTGVFGPFDRDVVAEATEKADAVAARTSAAVDDAKQKAGAAYEDAKVRTGAALDDAKRKAGAAYDDAKVRAEAAVANAADAVDDAKQRAGAAYDDAKVKAEAAVASAADAVDDAKQKAGAAAAGAAAAVDEAVAQVRASESAPPEATANTAPDGVTGEAAHADIAAADRVTDGPEPASAASSRDDAEVQAVVAEALEDAAIDIAIAADEVRADDETPAVDGVQSVVEDERHNS